METQKTIGSISAIWRFPVKSMRGERIEHAQVTERGILGDRAYALIDVVTGKVVSAKNVKLFSGILDCRRPRRTEERSQQG